ncbi:MAG: hypothetical protein Q9P01_20925 [Anaerolineae bacterium]|nr:hypothetical protein [Anaerolineae bacterium]
MAKNITPDEHPFLTTPHRTLITLSVPVLIVLSGRAIDRLG